MYTRAHENSNPSTATRGSKPCVTTAFCLWFFSWLRLGFLIGSASSVSYVSAVSRLCFRRVDTPFGLAFLCFHPVYRLFGPAPFGFPSFSSVSFRFCCSVGLTLTSFWFCRSVGPPRVGAPRLCIAGEARGTRRKHRLATQHARAAAHRRTHHLHRPTTRYSLPSIQLYCNLGCKRTSHNHHRHQRHHRRHRRHRHR